ncbi:MAG: ABC transporter permease subunit [Acidobacteriota bacterium]
MSAAIELGGVAVIAAVMGIMVYLVTVVTPLFRAARITGSVSYGLITKEEVQRLLFAEVDEYQSLGVYVLRSGDAVFFGAGSGHVLDRRRLVPDSESITAFSRSGAQQLAIGLTDGTVRVGRLGFDTSFVPEAEAPRAAVSLRPGERLEAPPGVIERTSTGELRRVWPKVEIEPPVEAAPPGAPAELLDYRAGDDEERLAVFRQDGDIHVDAISRRENMLTGEAATEVVSTSIPFPEALKPLGRPSFMLLASAGDQLYLAWKDGVVARFALQGTSGPQLAERADLTPAATLNDFIFSNGEQSLLASDSEGRANAWFRLPAGAGAQTADGFALVLAHRLPKLAAAITALGISGRDKTIIAGAADGEVVLYYLTSERLLARLNWAPAATVQITPKGDGIFAVDHDGRALLAGLSNPHPQTTLGSIFRKVWYEGYPAPAYTWQSSSATDDFEPKLSLIPLIFGTLKATLHSMLFAVPIALLAAIYTSEFLDRRYRAPLKSAIEMMASLPSVVLGFMAALVLAPVVEKSVLAVLVVFAVLPTAVLAFGYAWQLLPQRAALIMSGRPQMGILLLLVLCIAIAAPRLGGPIEHLMFAGDFKAWLDGRIGDATPGITVLAWPLAAGALLLLDRRLISGALQRRLGSASRSTVAAVDLLKYAVLIVFSVALAWAIGAALGRLGIDPRPHVFGTYVQRNALVTGFVMGFAVIPIIYTIAEDSLSAVPESLRSASLGCGATQWQTATRVVLPVAIPGIFSALMVGLGRAVGETMIVLMAAGNTAVLDLNIFSGLRTLSANIAVELPEAVKDGTLYRMLFLSALTLFALTFVVNTIAEIVRQRFRWRTHQL